MRIESASTDAIDRYEELAADFIPAIFGLNRDDCFITDESTLRDFCDVFNPEPRCDIDRQILDRYRVDVSDISDGNLLAVFQAIRQRRPRAGFGPLSVSRCGACVEPWQILVPERLEAD